VPERIAAAYSAAARVRAFPESFAVGLRRGLEAVCRDQGLAQGNLKSTLEKLAQKGAIPVVLDADEPVHPLLAGAIGRFPSSGSRTHLNRSRSPARLPQTNGRLPQHEMSALGAQYEYLTREAFEGVGGTPSTNESVIYTSVGCYPLDVLPAKIML
jgi:hypothetical protein